MASVTVSHRWDDESVTAVTVDVADSYPDSLSEARATAVRALLEITGAFDEVEVEDDGL